MCKIDFEKINNPHQFVKYLIIYDKGKETLTREVYSKSLCQAVLDFYFAFPDCRVTEAREI